MQRNIKIALIALGILVVAAVVFGVYDYTQARAGKGWVLSNWVAPRSELIEAAKRDSANEILTDSFDVAKSDFAEVYAEEGNDRTALEQKRIEAEKRQQQEQEEQSAGDTTPPPSTPTPTPAPTPSPTPPPTPAPTPTPAPAPTPTPTPTPDPEPEPEPEPEDELKLNISCSDWISLESCDGNLSGTDVWGDPCGTHAESPGVWEARLSGGVVEQRYCSATRDSGGQGSSSSSSYGYDYWADTQNYFPW